MKKILNYLFLTLLALFITSGVKAESIYSIKMDIHLDSNGNAHVTEVWDTNATEKTEYYHAFYNIGNSKITDFKVKDENREYTEIDWDINANLNDKAYKYGYNYTNDGVELCFGKSSYSHHTYTLTYTITNFVSNTEDAQIIYWNLLDSINPAPENVEIVIDADQPFSDDLDVWGYGNYGGLAYVYDGKIYLSNDDLKSDEYMVALVKFPLNTFNTTNNLEHDFDYYYKMAEDGATHYTEENQNSFISVFGPIIFWFGWLFFIIIFMANKNNKKINFGKGGNKLPKDVNLFREIPCNKDLLRAYWVAYNYGLMKKQTDLLGAILLKWLKQKKISVGSNTVGSIIKKEDSTIIFGSESQVFDNDLESRLYKYMYEASRDGILEGKEFEKWCRKNYSKILKWFDEVIDYETEILVNEGKIVKTEKVTLKIFKTTVYDVDPRMREEAIQMKGLKEFFNEFDNMKDKEAIEVMLWEEYLMYAQIFGMANKVAKQFKKLYPDMINDYDYDSIIFINTISYSGMSSAVSARSAAQAYSSGGGGFSSGGGGGGSFGGGGGGSR